MTVFFLDAYMSCINQKLDKDEHEGEMIVVTPESEFSDVEKIFEPSRGVEI